ncbi:MAG: DNA alkylation repair protein [Planctomycetota bacterium]
MTAQEVLRELKRASRPDKAEFLPGFFQAFDGGYGEGDRFLGCVVPDQRKIARKYRDLSRAELVKLFESPWHECRSTGMFVLVLQFERASRARNVDRTEERRELVDFYLEHRSAANNWDIVDGTAPKILGSWVLEHPDAREKLIRFSESADVWERRMAVLATLTLIRESQFSETIDLAVKLMNDDHELIHKAVGWMLREIGKQDPGVLRSFLALHAKLMPRTMLRYAIEKFDSKERKKWMTA